MLRNAPTSPIFAHLSARPLTRLAALLLLAFVCAPALGQKLKINNENVCDFSEHAQVSITGQGDVVISDPDNCQAVAEPALTVSPVLVEPASADPGDSVRVLWTSAGAESCEPAGDHPNWIIRSLGLHGVQTFNVGTTDGSYSIGVECGAPGQEPVLQTASLTVESSLPEQVPTITTFTATSRVTQGNDVTINWASTGATRCNAGGTLPGWKGLGQLDSTSGNKTIPIGTDVTARTYTAKLTCTNSKGSADETRNVTVNSPVAASCDSRQPPSHLNRRTYFLAAGGGSDFDSVWGPWPGNRSNPKNVILERNEYVALAFNSGNFRPGIDEWHVRVKTEASVGGVPGSSNSFGGILWAVSPCPGDFDKAAIQADESTSGRCIVSSNTIYLKTDLSNPSHCTLQPNTDYYLNITTQAPFTPVPDDPDDIVWDCALSGATTCGNSATISRNWPRAGE